MKIPGHDREPTYEELPNSVVAEKTQAISQDDIERIAAKPSRVVPVPDDKYPEGIAKRMQNLTQHSGRTTDGYKRSLANLRPKTHGMGGMGNIIKKTPELPANIPDVKVPVAIPDIPHGNLMRGKALQLCMSKEEYRLYVETWTEWFTDHLSEYTRVEDERDVHHICIETVKQYRINLLEQKYPNRDYSQPYNQSFNREQKARENLLARRTDRQNASGGGKGTKNVFNGNVAIMVGQISQEDREKRSVTALQQVDKFLESTETVDSQVSDDVIDAEVIETETDDASTNT